MTETYRTVHSQKLVRRNLFIYVKGVTFWLESDKQFSTQVSSVDEFSATSQQHDNQGKINNSPVELKLSAHIAAFHSAQSSDFQALAPSLCFFFSCWVSPSSFLALLPDQRWKFTQRESLFSSLSPSRVFTPSSSVLTSFPQRCAAACWLAAWNDNKKFHRLFKLFINLEAIWLCFRKFRLTCRTYCCVLQLFFIFSYFVVFNSVAG